MADGIELNAGTGGATLATDDAGASGHVQLVKLALSADGNATPITADANGLEVQGAGTAGTAAGGVVTVQGVASMTPIQIADNGGAITVDGTVAVSGTVTVDGSGATQPVSHAALTELGAAINASSQMDVNIAASAATVAVSHAALTELAAAINASSQMDVNIAASGATVPVSNAGLTELAAAIDTEVQCDIVGALPAGTNAIGKLAANSGVDIGDVDVTSIVPGTAATNLGKAEDAGHTTGDTGVAAWGVRVDTPNTALTNTDADYSPIAVNKLGSVRLAPPEDDFAVAGSNHVKKYYTSAGAVTDGIVWSPAAGKRWYITDIFINVSAAATVTLEDDKAGGDEAIWKAELAANSGWSHSFNTPWFSGEDAADLIITTSAGNVYVTVVGYEI